MDDNDTLRQILGFFAMMLGSLMDPIGLPCYIAIGLFVRNLAGALSVTLGFCVAFRVILAAIRSHTESGVETGSPDSEPIAAALAGAALVTGITYYFASRHRHRVKMDAAKDERKPDT